MSTVGNARNPSEAAEDLIRFWDFDRTIRKAMEAASTAHDLYDIHRQASLSDWLHNYVSEVVLSTGAYFSLGKDKGIYLDTYAAMDMEDQNDEMYGKRIDSLKSMFNEYIEDGHVERSIFVEYLRKLADDLEGQTIKNPRKRE